MPFGNYQAGRDQPRRPAERAAKRRVVGIGAVYKLPGSEPLRRRSIRMQRHGPKAHERCIVHLRIHKDFVISGGSVRFQIRCNSKRPVLDVRNDTSAAVWREVSIKRWLRPLLPGIIAMTPGQMERVSDSRTISTFRGSVLRGARFTAIRSCESSIKLIWSR